MAYADTVRGPAALAATIAVHAGVALAALLGTGIVTIPKPEPPAPPIPIIELRRPAPPPEPAPPVTRDLVRFDEPKAPVIDTFDPPVVPTGPTVEATPAEPPAQPDVTGPMVADLPPLPPAVEPTPARLDQRFAARFQPPYPAASRRLDEAGLVVVRVRVGVDGRVLAAEVARSSGHARLDDAAVARALEAWRFVPATVDGRPVEATREVPVRFSLASG